MKQLDRDIEKMGNIFNKIDHLLQKESNEKKTLLKTKSYYEIKKVRKSADQFDPMRKALFRESIVPCKKITLD